ncbi:hypothetical protein [Bradyrhizobium sp. CCGE-LA001]|uniref:hypothetical protein n=1 Tax=Bradyrhizobium sp. CCGE-LA001 TaxID=1223566 RepID=UPI0002AAB72C|nr:hypothetical protein [Bradyrhizobium sp. CCGE-LA001]AMA55691.1 hypothetical protein BCCGELA001_05000 [Bradyrhizobium sp. CCGE-LA001]
MAPNINRLTDIPEDKIVEEIQRAKLFDEPDIITVFRDGRGNFTLDSTVIVVTSPTGLSATPITKVGKMSEFGGPTDEGVRPDENLALFFNNPVDADANPDIFLAAQPAGTTGLARRLDPAANYLACRWDYAVTPKDYLRGIKVKVTNPANMRSVDARPVDFGPAEFTDRVADLSPGLARALGLQTNDTCRVDIPPPQTGVAVGVKLKQIDEGIFPRDMIRQLVVMTTSNRSTYWVINQLGTVEGGQTLLRKVGTNPAEILLSDTTVLPVRASDQVSEAVAAELNVAVVQGEPGASAPADPAPGPGADISARVFAKAQAFVNRSTRDVPGTDHGNLACAWAVNEVVRLALGRPVSADSHGNNGLGTRELFSVLKSRHTQISDPKPGALIISPTPPNGSVHGHVGIVGQNPGGTVGNTQIFSNSSAARKFAQNRTISSWNARYSAELHLPVLFFELNANQFSSVQHTTRIEAQPSTRRRRVS